MNFYESLGYLVLGSRLRRLSEAFLSEINKTYQAAGIDFDASWFPVFYLLSKNESLSIKELSDNTGVSHPAASQLVTNLKNKKLLKTTTCADDGRRQLVQLTKSRACFVGADFTGLGSHKPGHGRIGAAEPECRHLLPGCNSARKYVPGGKPVGKNRRKIIDLKTCSK